MPLDAEKVNALSDPKPDSAPGALLGSLWRDGDTTYCFRPTCEGCWFSDRCQRGEVDDHYLGPKPNVRGVFRPPPGYTLVAVDYSGVEVRIAANLARERVWIDAFLHGRDIHYSTASAMYGKPIEEVSKYERKIAKAGTFCALFGGGASTMAKNTGISLSQAEEAFSDFFKGLSGLRSWMDSQRARGRRELSISTFFGRKRDLTSYYASGEPKKIGYADRTCLNHPVQGTAADVMKLTMVKVISEIHKRDWEDICYPVWTIHDELGFIVDRKRVMEVAAELREVMTFEVSSWDVPLTVDVEVGDTWGTMKEINEIPPEELERMYGVNPRGYGFFGGSELESKGQEETEVPILTPKLDPEPTGYADLHLEDIKLTSRLAGKIRKATIASPGTCVVRLHFSDRPPVELDLGLVDRDTFLERVME